MFNLTEFKDDFEKEVFDLVSQKINSYFKNNLQITKDKKIISIIRLCDIVMNGMDGISRDNVMQLIHGLALIKEEGQG